ncbi:MAG TPA: YIP1 family protein [Candidatus Xenobia bacterium]|nr:YIP1 family protein [Candidatus Xenobia bacterium]
MNHEQPAVPGRVKTWAYVAAGFAVFYLLVAIQQFWSRPFLYRVVGPFCLLICVLLALGCFLALNGQYKRARIALMIGGILGLPLGIVMLIAASKIGKAALEMPAVSVSPAVSAGETRAAGGAEPMSELDRLTGVLFDPKPAFADIAQRPRPWAPLVLLTLLSTVFIVLFSQRVGWEQVVRKAIESNPRAMERIPADQLDRVVEQQAKISAIFGYVFSVVGTALFGLILAAFYLFVFNVLAGADVRFMQSFGIVSYAMLPRGLLAILAMALMYIKDPAEFDIQNPAATNLGVFLDPDAVPRWVQAVAGSIDIFTIWGLILLAVGYSAAARKMSWGRAFGWVLGTWIFWLVLVGLGTWIFS